MPDKKAARAEKFRLALMLFFALLTPNLTLAQDTDLDGMPDSYENTYGCLMPNTVDAGVDYDSDSLTSLQEYQYSAELNPCAADTDGDSVTDTIEVGHPCLSPTNPDTDGNGFSDGLEDTDNDGMPDKWEINMGLDPLTDDALENNDGDPYTNFEEYLYQLDPRHNGAARPGDVGARPPRLRPVVRPGASRRGFQER